MIKMIHTVAIVCSLALCLTGCSSIAQTLPASSTPEVSVEQEKIYFKSDKGLNRFFEEYSAIAEYPFEPEDIRQGNVRTKALISTGDIFIELVNSANGLTILLDDGPNESDALYPIFHDFLKVIDDSLSDEQIAQAWADIKDIGTKYYSEGAYPLNDIKLTYSDVEFHGSRQVKVNIYAPEYQG